MKNKLLFWPLAFAAFAAVAQPSDEVVVAGGKYYVGGVFGQHDYAAHPNITLTAFRIMRSEVTYRSYTDVHEWALAHGYAFGAGCNGASYEDCLPAATDKGMHPVTNVEWSDAVVFANALSEKSGLKPVYLNKNGDPARDSSTYQFTQDTQANGYRLPTAKEWQVAARGGKPALEKGSYGDAFAGGKNANSVAWFPDFNDPYFGTTRVKSRQANVLGLYDMSGNVSEWVDAFDTISDVKMYYFCGGSFMVHTNSLAACDTHSAGYALPDIGFRLVRKL
ncbi:fibrobacter succinogenes paralogous family [Serratia marcescens]|uniref:formylglycine-generating enzyme family protein n=1 Tax=Serratia marcescens TaxID=615 RepID=UPI0021772F96|nr:formylglycine-generating enzyme family protein [Serratia marcescens]CAI1827096.1 fibrobacter succinogenes paralogous family [Serratia marcescens]